MITKIYNQKTNETIGIEDGNDTLYRKLYDEWKTMNANERKSLLNLLRAGEQLLPDSRAKN